MPKISDETAKRRTRLIKDVKRFMTSNELTPGDIADRTGIARSVVTQHLNGITQPARNWVVDAYMMMLQGKSNVAIEDLSHTLHLTLPRGSKVVLGDLGTVEINSRIILDVK